MNGGDTFITRSRASLTAVRSHGIFKKGNLQVYAPITNENLYTNLWRGPFYGFERVIETFSMTETPRRLKAVDIYYHTYSASKPASLTALHQVYGWALKQPLHPVFASEYIRKVHDFYAMALRVMGKAGASAAAAICAPCASPNPGAPWIWRTAKALPAARPPTPTPMCT
jgi:hypothetical protein